LRSPLFDVRVCFLRCRYLSTKEIDKWRTSVREANIVRNCTS